MASDNHEFRREWGSDILSIPAGIKLLLPWSEITSSEIENRALRLSVELARQISPEHMLYGLKARVIAARIDRDDVLFALEGADMPLAVVHLTWRKETDPSWPITTLFESWEQWVRDEMIPSHHAYTLQDDHLL